MLENTIHLIVGLARAEKALFTVTGTSLGTFLHIDPCDSWLLFLSRSYHLCMLLTEFQFTREYWLKFRIWAEGMHSYLADWVESRLQP